MSIAKQIVLATIKIKKFWGRVCIKAKSLNFKEKQNKQTNKLSLFLNYMIQTEFIKCLLK